MFQSGRRSGNPWGFGIDPTPALRPGTTPTLYSPAGCGSVGAWKSTDGAATWTRLAGADAAFAPYNPFGAGLTDLYQLAVLPDDPPNHVLATYHDGTMSPAAWSKVSSAEHAHGSFTMARIANGTWYAPGIGLILSDDFEN